MAAVLFFQIGPMTKEGASRGSQHRRGCILTPAARPGDALAPRSGHVWYHAPSGQLLEDGLPQEWIEFSRIAGGILADVSPASWLLPAVVCQNTFGVL